MSDYRCEIHLTNEGFIDSQGVWHCWECYRTRFNKYITNISMYTSRNNLSVMHWGDFEHLKSQLTPYLSQQQLAKLDVPLIIEKHVGYSIFRMIAKFYTTSSRYTRTPSVNEPHFCITIIQNHGLSVSFMFGKDFDTFIDTLHYYTDDLFSVARDVISNMTSYTNASITEIDY